ncbi:MAG: hypothetical protein ABI871_00390 [Chthoniobacterales bacterium]
MALHLNLLHEEILQQRQRQRDPLKLGLIVMGAFGALMFFYYMWNAYQTLEIKSQLSATQREWAKVEPKVTAVQKRATELTAIISTTKVLDGIIESRFYWAPFLEKLARCVAPNVQLTSVEGTVSEESKSVNVVIEGVAAGREARGAAEELRQLLTEQIGQDHKDVKVDFKSLEDLDTVVNIGGANMPTARYALVVSFDPSAAGASAAASPAPARKPKEKPE